MISIIKNLGYFNTNIRTPTYNLILIKGTSYYLYLIIRYRDFSAIVLNTLSQDVLYSIKHLKRRYIWIV